MPSLLLTCTITDRVFLLPCVWVKLDRVQTSQPNKAGLSQSNLNYLLSSLSILLKLEADGG